MIDREHDLPITKQAEVLKLSRSSVYYLPRPVSPDLIGPYDWYKIGIQRDTSGVQN
jgi:hypothetical protein